MNPSMAGGNRFSATSRQEFIGTIQLPTTNTVVQLPTGGGLIPNDRFMYGMWFTWRGRMTNPAANGPLTINADAPFSLIENIQVQGYHRVRGANEPFINLRGCDLRELNKVYGACTPYVAPNNPALSASGIFDAQLSPVASDTNDIEFTIYLPFTPCNVPIGSQMGFLLDAPNYDRLQLNITFGDATSVFGGQTVQPTFTAFGSNAGNPTITVEGQFALGQQASFGYVPARVWRYFAENATGDILAVVNGSRQYNVPRGNYIRHIMMKTGLKSTTATAGLNPFATLSDNIFANIQLMRGLGRPVRNYAFYRSLRNEIQQAYGMYGSQGYALMDFAVRGSLTETMNTIGMIAGPAGDTDLYVQADVTGAAATAATFIVEELRGQPQRLQARS